MVSGVMAWRDCPHDDLEWSPVVMDMAPEIRGATCRKCGAAGAYQDFEDGTDPWTWREPEKG